MILAGPWWIEDLRGCYAPSLSALFKRHGLPTD